MRIVNGDIGGTNARLQLWESESDNPSFQDFKLVANSVLPSKDFTGLAQLVVAFLNAAGHPTSQAIEAACIAVCGPVENEERMCGPELPEQPPTRWNANKKDLTTGVLEGVIKKAVLVNDFIGVGLGLTALDRQKDLEALHDVPRNEQGVMVCVGAGTGLGEVYLTAHGGQHVAFPSEGGMTEFHAQDEEQWRLRQYLHKRDGHVTVEGVVSGPGIANVYQFLQSERGEAVAETGDRLEKWVAGHALAETDPTCVRAVDIMLRAFGAECRATALRHLPSGGVYVAGGLAPKLLPRLRTVLKQSYLEDSVMGDLIRLFPLYVVLDDNVGLLGARVRAYRLLHE